MALTVTGWGCSFRRATTWLTTPATAATFTGLPGQTYAFRLRAVDALGNQSDWTPKAATTIAEATKYYTLGSQRVAMRRGDVVYYLHGDHLGSTSLTTDSDGSVVSQARYLPYGEERWSSGAPPTDFTFTAQRNEAGFGLMDYNARYYSPALGRFISPDSIVPEPGSSGGFNRYRYARNNPLKYTDPSGHCVWDLCIAEVSAATYVGLTAFVALGVIVTSEPFQRGARNVVNDAIKAFPGSAPNIDPLPGYGEGELQIPDPGIYPQPVLDTGELLGGQYTTPFGDASLGTSTEFPLLDPMAFGDGILTSSSTEHSTYGLVDPLTGETRYVGRTKNLEIRKSAHGRDPEKAGLDFVPDRSGLTYPQARGREQLLIEEYGLGNLIE